MFGLDKLETLFLVTAFLFQIVLIIHFTIRWRRLETAILYGWIVYALSIPAAVVSVILLLGSKVWWLWLGGFLYLVWAGFGYVVEYVKKIEWRSPPRWGVFGPYLILYLATVMFYWWPLARLYKPAWMVYTVLFIISTGLNMASHEKKERSPSV